jgi:hypothetical protein
MTNEELGQALFTLLEQAEALVPAGDDHLYGDWITHLTDHVNDLLQVELD